MSRVESFYAKHFGHLARQLGRIGEALLQTYQGRVAEVGRVLGKLSTSGVDAAYCLHVLVNTWAAYYRPLRLEWEARESLATLSPKQRAEILRRIRSLRGHLDRLPFARTPEGREIRGLLPRCRLHRRQSPEVFRRRGPDGGIVHIGPGDKRIDEVLEREDYEECINLVQTLARWEALLAPSGIARAVTFELARRAGAGRGESERLRTACLIELRNAGAKPGPVFDLMDGFGVLPPGQQRADDPWAVRRRATIGLMKKRYVRHRAEAEDALTRLGSVVARLRATFAGLKAKLLTPASYSPATARLTRWRARWWGVRLDEYRQYFAHYCALVGVKPDRRGLRCFERSLKGWKTDEGRPPGRALRRRMFRDPWEVGDSRL